VAGGLSERRHTLVVQARLRAPARAAAGLGFTATKKVGGSVVRNRARRRLREAARMLLPRLGLSGADYVMIARQDTGACPWSRLLDDMESALISLRGRLATGQMAASPPATGDDPGRDPS
jgi:ribonuclease P protein component